MPQRPKLRLPWKIRYQAIKQLIESPCHDKWSVLIKTALPAAANGIFILLTPTPEEVLEEYLHPKVGRRRGRFRGGGTRRRWDGRAAGWRRAFEKGCPDVDEVIAHRLPGREIFAGRTAHGLERAFWLGIDVLDRLLWRWLLYEIGEQGTIIWASNIMESRFCSRAYRSVLVWDIPHDLLSGSGAWYNPSLVSWISRHNMSVGYNGQCGPLVGAPMDGVIWFAKSLKAVPSGTPYWTRTWRGQVIQVQIKIGYADGSWVTHYGPEIRELGIREVTSSLVVNAENVRTMVLDTLQGTYVEQGDYHWEQNFRQERHSEGAILLS